MVGFGACFTSFCLFHGMFLFPWTCRELISHSVFKVVLLKSILTLIRQLILYISKSKGQGDGFVEELTSAKRLSEHFMRDKIGIRESRGGPVRGSPAGVNRPEVD